MNHDHAREDRPDIVAAIRGGDSSLGMNDGADPAAASLEQALFWRDIYAEILTMEEAVLEPHWELWRLHQTQGGSMSTQFRCYVRLRDRPRGDLRRVR
jgi:hypothetical protein